jgi:DNA-binding LytR/AlgR family response regulator
MKPLRCLALDDEPLALGLLAEYIEKTPFLELAGKCDSAVEALSIINSKPIDLIFSDIQMNDLSGIELARVINGLEKKPLLIFTTAYEQYALQGYKVDAIDYLLKPFSYEEFLRAASKAQSFIREKPSSASSHKQDTRDFILFKVEYQYEKVFYDDILYVEGLKDYVKVHLSNRQKPLLSLMSLKSLEAKLPDDRFMRIHRSFIVNLEKINSFGRTSVHIADQEIPVSENYRDKIQDYFKDHLE